MSLYTRKATTINSSLSAKEKAQALRSAADATNPARWLATLAASPTTSRNNQLLAADLRAKVEADPAIRDAVYVALVLATANAHAEADRVFVEPVTRGRRAKTTLKSAQKAANAKKAADADATIKADFEKYCKEECYAVQRGLNIATVARMFVRYTSHKPRRYRDRFNKLLAADQLQLPKI